MKVCTECIYFRPERLDDDGVCIMGPYIAHVNIKEANECDYFESVNKTYGESHIKEAYKAWKALQEIEKLQHRG